MQSVKEERTWKRKTMDENRGKFSSGNECNLRLNPYGYSSSGPIAQKVRTCINDVEWNAACMLQIFLLLQLAVLHLFFFVFGDVACRTSFGNMAKYCHITLRAP